MTFIKTIIIIENSKGTPEHLGVPLLFFIESKRLNLEIEKLVSSAIFWGPSHLELHDMLWWAGEKWGICLNQTK